MSLVLRRIFWIVPVLLVVACATFVLMHRAPGGPWDHAKPVPPATRKRLNVMFGLDKPLWLNPAAARAAHAGGVDNPLVLGRALLDSQFFNYLLDAARGDLGPTYKSGGADRVQHVIARKLPASVKVGLVGILFALLVGVPLGTLGALRQNSWLDYISLAVGTVGVAVPAFIAGVLLIVVLSATAGINPIRRPEEWNGLGAAYLLPGMVLGLGPLAYMTRLTRSSMLECKRQDYVRTARAKGLAETRVVGRHMLRNSLLPVLTLLGPTLADLVTGSFIVESIFGVPGLGREFVTSITQRDYSMIMGTTLFYALLVALANICVDLCYGLVDPRIRVR